MRVMPIRRSEHARVGPLRLKPEQGQPRCLLEQFAQHVYTHKLAWFSTLGIWLTVTMIVLQFFYGVHR